MPEPEAGYEPPTDLRSAISSSQPGSSSSPDTFFQGTRQGSLGMGFPSEALGWTQEPGHLPVITA